jgi:hypothetical protein
MHHLDSKADIHYGHATFRALRALVILAAQTHIERLNIDAQTQTANAGGRRLPTAWVSDGDQRQTIDG